MKNYLEHALKILNKTENRNIKIRATGDEIVKAVILIELVKKQIPELHQINKIYSLKFKLNNKLKEEAEKSDLTY